MLCDKYIPKEHCFSKEHISNFENNISIKTKDSIKKKFVDLIFDFYIIDKNAFYKDLYFKDYFKKIIIKIVIMIKIIKSLYINLIKL